jgi:protein dithiol:quinone oxidoreductase
MLEQFTPRRLLWAALLLPITAVLLALFTQHVWDMQPCPWCVLQRVIFLVIALLALLALLMGSHGQARRVLAGLMLLVAASGAAAALWQHFVATSSTSCAMTLADRFMMTTGLADWWPEVFAAYASCADAAVKLLGLPFEFYSLALFAALGLGAGLLIRRPV